jgi:hypothetical protein
MRKLLVAFTPLVFAVAMTLGGCQWMTSGATKPVAGFVTDTKSFDAFIETHPTPKQFHRAYPDVQLVVPGTITSLEYRENNSRYYGKFDEKGRIIGGNFG